MTYRKGKKGIYIRCLRWFGGFPVRTSKVVTEDTLNSRDRHLLLLLSETLLRP